MLPGRQQAKPSLCLKQVDHWRTPLHPICIFINCTGQKTVCDWISNFSALLLKSCPNWHSKNLLIKKTPLFRIWSSGCRCKRWRAYTCAKMEEIERILINCQWWYWYCYWYRWYWLILPLAWLELIFDTVLVAFPFHLGMILWCDDDHSDDHQDLD